MSRVFSEASWDCCSAVILTIIQLEINVKMIKLHHFPCSSPYSSICYFLGRKKRVSGSRGTSGITTFLPGCSSSAGLVALLFVCSLQPEILNKRASVVSRRAGRKEILLGYVQVFYKDGKDMTLLIGRGELLYSGSKLVLARNRNMVPAKTFNPK